MYYVGNRRHEGIQELKVDDFDFEFDSQGNEYVCMVNSIRQKNVKPSFRKKEFESSEQLRISKLSI